MQKHIITLSGFPGSGKSSTGKRLAEMLGYKRYSSGDFMREVGQRHGLSIEETNKAAETNPTFDQEVDAAVQAKGREEDLVIDSRTAFHWIPQSFKVLLTIDTTLAAKRIFAQMQNEGRFAEEATSIEGVLQSLIARKESEFRRYREKYGIDYSDESQFDLVINTADFPLEEVVNRIATAYTERLTTSTRG